MRDAQVELAGVRLVSSARRQRDHRLDAEWGRRVDERTLAEGVSRYGPMSCFSTRLGRDTPRERTRLGEGHASRRGHANGAIAVDHVVVATPDFERTREALARAGMPLKRVTEMRGTRMGFRRVGPAILELVEAPHAERPAFWGLAIVVRDLDALANRLGDRLGEIRPAVQPGRRIATVRPSAGISTNLAFMDSAKAVKS